jgi:hypothetical protein
LLGILDHCGPDATTPPLGSSRDILQLVPIDTKHADREAVADGDTNPASDALSYEPLPVWLAVNGGGSAKAITLDAREPDGI